MTSRFVEEAPKFELGHRSQGSFSVVLGELTFVDWLSQIEFEFTHRLADAGSNVRVTRLYRALRFELAGRIFASLIIDDDGLLLRQWEPDGSHQDHAGLDSKIAQELIKLSIMAAEARTLTD